MRGFWHTIETVLITTIVITFLMTVGAKYASVIQPENLAEKGYIILENLDNRGELRNYTVALDYNGLNSQIPIYVYNHSIQICDYTGTCTGTRPNAINIWTANYIISGENVYQPFTIKLYIFPL